MVGKNKFGFDQLETKSTTPSRNKTVGPMGAAAREAAGSLQESTEAKIVQRRKNATDAKEYRAALDEGRVLVSLDINQIKTDDLPRDRLDLSGVASSDEMEELKASIRTRGQREPIEVYLDADGHYQLMKGWRRLTALGQLYAETAEDAFATVMARVTEVKGDRMALYIDMVEENIIRSDLSFAEMAKLAITVAEDPSFDGLGADAAVGRLYGSLHKMKRSYIRSFVFLLGKLDDVLHAPQEIPRNLGVDVARILKADDSHLENLIEQLARVSSGDNQNALLAQFVASEKGAKSKTRPKATKEKYEFYVGDVKITARQGEVRLLSTQDYSDVPKERLEHAVKLFHKALQDGSVPRIRRL